MKTICYLSGGYPSLEKSYEMAKLYAEGGCDAIEWSLPAKDPYLEMDYIAEKMAAARAQCSDYARYLADIARFKREYPHMEVYLLLYQECVFDIGVEELARFCTGNGIDTIITADFNEPAATARLAQSGVHVAPFVSFQMKPQMVAEALKSQTFVYMQAMPYANERTPDFDWDTLKNCIAGLRRQGLRCPVYCGGAIRSPEEVAFIRASGGDGFFIGSSVMQYYGQPEKLLETLRAYKAAAQGA